MLKTLEELTLIQKYLQDLKKVKIVVNKPKVRNLLKKYKIEFDSDLFDSMNTIQKTARSARKGFRTKIKHLAKKIGYDGFTGADDYKNSPSLHHQEKKTGAKISS